MRILRAIISSFARQSDFSVDIMADSYASVYREYKPEILEFEKNYPEIRVHDDLEDICYKIVETLEIIKDRSNTRKQLIVWLGLDSMADILADERNKRTPVLKKQKRKQRSRKYRRAFLRKNQKKQILMTRHWTNSVLCLVIWICLEKKILMKKSRKPGRSTDFLFI